MQTISGAELKRMILSAAASIEIHKQDLNELNVFPEFAVIVDNCVYSSDNLRCR